MCHNLILRQCTFPRSPWTHCVPKIRGTWCAWMSSRFPNPPDFTNLTPPLPALPKSTTQSSLCTYNHRPNVLFVILHWNVEIYTDRHNAMGICKVSTKSGTAAGLILIKVLNFELIWLQAIMLFPLYHNMCFWYLRVNSQIFNGIVCKTKLPTSLTALPQVVDKNWDV